MERLRGIDSAFLHLDTPSTRWVILAALILEPTDANPTLDADDVRNLWQARMPQLGAMRRRILGNRALVSRPLWEDETPDVSDHVRVVRVEGGGAEELAAWAGDEAEHPMPSDGHLWEMLVVEGLDHGRVGLVVKLHHSITDGVSALGLLAGLVDTEPTPPPPPTPPAPRHHAEVPPVGAWAAEAAGAMARDLAQRPGVVVRSAAEAANGLRRAAGRLTTGRGGVSLPLMAPRTPMNAALTPAREVGLVDLPVSRVLGVKKATGATFTDVFAAIVTGALRVWLAEAGALPDRPLLAAVPAAAATDIPGMVGSTPGNQLSVLFAHLPTDDPDPVRRLGFLGERLHTGRLVRDDLGPLLAAVGELAPWRLIGAGFNLFTRLDGADRLPPVANLLLTTLPGPREPLYMAGGRIVGLYPIAPILDGIGLNITVVSYEDRVFAGILGCPAKLPPLSGLVHAFSVALDELEEFAPRAGSIRPPDLGPVP